MNSSLDTSDPSPAHGIRETVSALLDLMRVKNPWGTFLLLIPSLWALTLAGGGRPDPRLLIIFTVGAFLMRSAGCIINDVADRKIDPLVSRTRGRPLASGRLSVPVALVAFAVLVGISVLLIAHLNRLTIVLAACGLGLAVLYPFTKRFVSIPQAFLGMAFGWGAFMAWAAVKNELALTPALLFAATIFWAVAYDTIYAIQDIEDDKKVGVKSSAILFGSAAWAWIIGCLLVTCLLLAMAGAREGMGPLYLTVVAAAGIYFIRQGIQVKAGLSRAQAFALFRAHVPAGAVILLAMLITPLIRAV